MVPKLEKRREGRERGKHAHSSPCPRNVCVFKDTGVYQRWALLGQGRICCYSNVSILDLGKLI